MTRGKTAILGALAVAGIALSFLLQQRDMSRLRHENEALLSQVTRLQSGYDDLSNRVNQSPSPPAVSNERLRELLRLRGEVSSLRSQNRELERAAAAANRDPSNSTAVTPSTQAPLPSQPAPFQVQLVVDEPGDDTETLTNKVSGGSGETVYLRRQPLLDYSAIQSAVVTTDPTTGSAQIEVQFNDVGRELFAGITKEHINKRLAIVLNGHLYAAPLIRSEISGGKAQITGAFTQEEASELAARINDAISGK